MKHKLYFLGILFLLACCFQAKAQPGAIDLTFNPGTGTNGCVNTSAVQSDGKILIGGHFTSFNGTPRNRIARLNADGTLDPTFNSSTGANGEIYIITLQGDGKIIIGGVFSSYNGVSRNHLARLNADGTLDTTFNPGTGSNGEVLTTALQNDGKIIIGGDFNSYDGAGRNMVARVLHCHNSSAFIPISACFSYTAPDGQVYTTSGIKTAIIPNAVGCDSIITIDLTINAVDVTTLVKNSVIVANAEGATYQWLDCNNAYAAIPGATNQSYSADHGSYAVAISQNACTDTSACISIAGIEDKSFERISVYPNPARDEFTIEMPGNQETLTLQLLNTMGAVVFSGTLMDKTVVPTNDLAPGRYIIKLEKNDFRAFKKILIE